MTVIIAADPTQNSIERDATSIWLEGVRAARFFDVATENGREIGSLDAVSIDATVV